MALDGVNIGDAGPFATAETFGRESGTQPNMHFASEEGEDPDAERMIDEDI